MRLFILLIYLTIPSYNIFASDDFSDSIIQNKNQLPSFSLSPKIINNELYSETFTLFADLENGQYIYSQIGITNIGPGDRKGLCRIMLSRPNHKTLNLSEIYDTQEWHFSSQPFPSLNVGQCALTLNNDNHLVFNGSIKDISIEINLMHNAAVLINSKTTKNIKNDDGGYFAEILIPWSQAKASYSINSKKHPLNSSSKQISGFGYADHSISTLLPGNIASKWIRFRGINAQHSRLLLARFPVKSKATEAWLWQQEASLNAVTFKSETISRINKNKMPKFIFETKLANNTQSNTSTEYSIIAKQLIYRHAPLEEKGLLGKVLSKLIGNPVTYIYRATISSNSGNQLNHTNKPITGILEVSYANE